MIPTDTLGLLRGLLLGEPDWALLCELFGKPGEAGAALREATAAPGGRGFEPDAFCAGLRRAVALHFAEDEGAR